MMTKKVINIVQGNNLGIYRLHRHIVRSEHGGNKCRAEQQEHIK
jgi:hypothetical protein